LSNRLSKYPCPPAQGLITDRLWQETHFPEPPMPSFRLAQGPFGISGDDGWRLAGSTCVNSQYYPNPGMGFIAYAWEESGPSLAARTGKQTLEEHVEALLALPFVDILYIRCDWRDVQTHPGRLDLMPIWDIALNAAKRYGKRLAFRIQMSTTVGQPGRMAIPDFLQKKVPCTHVNSNMWQHDNPDGFIEPRYDDLVFLEAAVELSEMLAARFDAEECLEFVDLMMFGFWGEGHTNDYPNPIPFADCEKVFLHLTEAQRRIWKNTPLCVNIQTDISRAGNRAVQDLAIRNHMYLRSDSIMFNEPQSNEQIAHRPPHIPLILEDGTYRTYDMSSNWFSFDANGVNVIENTIMHSLDLGGNYFALWTEGESFRAYYEKYPTGFDTLRARLGYRVRPSWIYQRKRFGTSELLLILHNDGVASVPGHLLLSLTDETGTVLSEGCLDAGHPYAGKTRQCAFLLPKGFEGRSVYLHAYLMDQKGKRPVHFACQNAATLITGRAEVAAPCVIEDMEAAPGPNEYSFRIKLAAFDANDWRKDI
jgi:hypothetical protein